MCCFLYLKLSLASEQPASAEKFSFKPVELATFFAEKPIESAIFSLDNKSVVAKNGDNLTIWDIQTTKQISQSNPGAEYSLLLGNFPILWPIWPVFANGKTAIYREGKLLYYINLNVSSRMAILSPDQRYFVTASDDGFIRVWKTENGELLFERFAHTQAVRSVRFSSDTKYLLSASDDCTAKIWILPSDELLHVHTLKSKIYVDLIKEYVEPLDDNRNYFGFIKFLSSVHGENAQRIEKMIFETMELDTQIYLNYLMPNRPSAENLEPKI